MKNTVLKRIVFLVIVCIGLTFGLMTTAVTSDDTYIPVKHVTVSKDAIKNEIKSHMQNYDYIPVDNKLAVIKQQDVLNNYIKYLKNQLAKYDYCSDEYKIAYNVLKPEILRVKQIILRYNQDYKNYVQQEMIEAFWAPKTEEYPVATQVWRMMKEEFGWSDTVCAGIMGNLMAECGGCWTHDLNWQSNHSGGLGMIQWMGSRCKAIINKYGEMPTVEEQIQFMYDEMYGTNGVHREITQKQLDAIMNAETPEECAYLFAIYFERCRSDHVAHRRGLARTSYNYFTK